MRRPSFSIATLAANGQLFDAATGGNLLGAGSSVPATGSGPYSATVYFQPNANWNGSTAFTYTASDGAATSAAATGLDQRQGGAPTHRSWPTPSLTRNSLGGYGLEFHGPG